MTLQLIQLFNCNHIAKDKVRGLFPEPAVLSRCCPGSYHGVGTTASDREGISVAGSLSPHNCSAVRAYARRSAPGRDTMLSSHALSSKRPSGGSERRRTSATCQGEEGTQTKGQWEQQWEEEHVQERQRGKRDVLNDRRAERGEGKTRRQGKDLWWCQELFSYLKKNPREEKKKAKNQVLGVV